ncbi:hypothetical protein [Citrobacter youngae]|uniref:hypothetical protein n=1 Tax=Citrobacter youngae TaxID=133448 RepID=UPI00397B928A
MTDSIFDRFLSDLDEIISTEVTLKASKVRKVLDESNDEHWVIAETYYEEIRSDLADVQKICTNIDESERVVTRVKDHLFFNEHIIITDNIEEKRRLDSDPEIVNAWSRLTEGDFTPTDLSFFKHEQVESILEKRKKLDYRSAHLETLNLGYRWNPEEAYDGDPGNS